MWRRRRLLPRGATKGHKEDHKRHKRFICAFAIFFVLSVIFFVLFAILFNRYGFREVSWLIDVATASYGDVIGQQL